ncbi:MAG: 16S rRNA (adenine(1518)-N(6)/adenine(1519)-N(6))-dimethyltransferase RsmA [Chitinophagales bacterium]
MAYVPPKKRFGQHYLMDESVLEDTIQLLKDNHTAECILEVGPGMGALTQYLWRDFKDQLKLVELDRRCVKYLSKEYNGIAENLIEGDFLQLDLDDLIDKPTTIIGNFPYNISSQIVFKILESDIKIPLVIGMFQKEVGVRLAGKPGNKSYGAISVLAQLKYDIQVAFHIGPEKFNPPPKVISSVIIMKRRAVPYSGFDHKALRTMVKSAFGMRRKKLSNALAGILEGRSLPEKFAHLRAEALSIEDFIELTNWWQDGQQNA